MLRQEANADRPVTMRTEPRKEKRKKKPLALCKPKALQVVIFYNYGFCITSRNKVSTDLSYEFFSLFI